ncbi:MAG: acyl-CoA dehydrogenase family protein [Ilumatobacteraceae bacterium]
MSSLVEAARSVLPIVVAHADQGERDRRLPAAVVDALRDAGLMRMCVPAGYGGPAADPHTLVEAVEAIAVADAAAGWCASIASTTSSLVCFLEPAWAREIYGDPSVVTGGVFAPNATAEAVEGGWRATGRWMWGSGTGHCRYVCGGAIVPGGETQQPQQYVMFFDAADVTFHDTWHSLGLRASGSGDFAVDGAFVPTGRAFAAFAARPTIDAPIARFPNFTLLAIGIAAVALGIARHALDAFAELAMDKRPQFSGRTLAQNGVIQADIARAEAGVRSARAWLLDEIDTAWTAVERGGRLTDDVRANLRLAGANAATRAAQAVDTAFTWAGGTAVFQSSPLQRCLRDVHVVTQHIQVSPRLYETIGRFLLGNDTDMRMM